MGKNYGQIRAPTGLVVSKPEKSRVRLELPMGVNKAQLMKLAGAESTPVLPISSAQLKLATKGFGLKTSQRIVPPTASVHRYNNPKAWFAGVAVEVGVCVGEGVCEGVGVSVGVDVSVGVSVLVAVMVNVYVGVKVMVGVRVNVGKGVELGVKVQVGMGVRVCVLVGVRVGVKVNVKVGVGVRVRVGVSVLVGMKSGVVLKSNFSTGGKVPAWSLVACGVRKESLQEGGVKISGRMAGMRSLGRA